MASGFRAECDECGWTGPARLSEVEAAGDVGTHPGCPPRCGGCGFRVPFLVDDGPLCIRCDRFHFPAMMTDRRAS